MHMVPDPYKPFLDFSMLHVFRQSFVVPVPHANCTCIKEMFDLFGSLKTAKGGVGRKEEEIFISISSKALP